MLSTRGRSRSLSVLVSFFAACLAAPAADAAEWQEIVSPGVFTHGVGFDPVDPDRMFIGTWGRGLYRTVDGGVTWQGDSGSFTHDGGIVSTQDVVLDPANPNRGVATTRNGTYVTTTRGQLWSRHPQNNGGAPLSAYDIALLPDSSGVAISELASNFGGGKLWIYEWETDLFSTGTASDRLVTLDGESTLGIGFSVSGTLMFGHTTTVFSSDDLGATLDRNGTGLPDFQPRAVVPDPETTGVTLCAVDGGLYRQTSVGGTWTLYSSQLPSPVRDVIHHPNDADVMFAATNFGVYTSDDRGLTWTAIPTTGMRGPVIVEVAVNPLEPEWLYATANRVDRTNGGLYRLAIDVVTDVEVSPAKGFVARARPNPFTARTEIGFTLARPAAVRVDLFDVSGRRLGTLVDGRLDAGAHAPAWDGRDDDGRRLGNGVYFYRVTLDGRTAASGRLTLRR